VLTQIDPLCVGAIAGDSELDAEEPAVCRRRDVNVDHAVAQLDVLQYGSSAIEEETGAALVVDDFRLLLQFPTR
jgi:hypothetical protein